MNTQTKEKNNNVLIAIIGLIGIIIGSLFSNLDKIFPEGDGTYKPTNNFESEIRHYLNISGTRDAYDYMLKGMTNSFMVNQLKKYPQDSGKIVKIANIVREEAITLDEVIPKMLPIYRKYFTLQEIQELNKFYSTKVVQDMVKKTALLATDAAPIQVEIMTNYVERYLKRIKEEGIF